MAPCRWPDQRSRISRYATRAAAEVADRQQGLGLLDQGLLGDAVGPELGVLLATSPPTWPRRTRPGRRGTSSTARRRHPWAPSRRPSSGSSGRGTPRWSDPSRSSSAAPRLRRPAAPWSCEPSLAVRTPWRTGPCAAACRWCGHWRTGASSSSSVARSSRGRVFHSSSSSRNRLTPPRQSLPAASFSASTTNRSLACLASALALARSALRAARWSATFGTRASNRAVRPSRSPTAWASFSAERTVLIEDTRVIGGERARRDPGLQQRDLQLERLVPAGEEGHRLLGRHVGHLPDGALAGLRADVHRPVLVDPAEGGRPGMRGDGALRRS